MFLPIGYKIVRGHVVAISLDVKGNIMERAHINMIFDTGMYQVKFAGGDVTELIANVIAESLYTMCDADVNEYLLFDFLVHYVSMKRQFSLQNSRSQYSGDQ